MALKTFADLLLDWQAVHGRHHLPWQNTGSAYCTWLSEVMLQQTQVSTVLGYYARFVERFPTIADLANAHEDEVMQLWQGLGYYSRARNLHACAKAVVSLHGGDFPRDLNALEALPGIGRSTAGAIASLGLGLRAPILDGNVKRVFSRHWAVEGSVDQASTLKRLWAIAEREVPVQSAGRYNQALMDLGATVCTRGEPACERCPVSHSCEALRQGRVMHLPSPKAKKVSPNWYFVALMAKHDDGRVWLEQRPDTGLWRKLWLPPMLRLSLDDTLAPEQLDPHMLSAALMAADFSDSAAWQLAMDTARVGTSQPDWLVHVLTHRRVHVLPISLHATYVPNGRWVNPQNVALPALTVKLLRWLDHVAVTQQDGFDFG